VTRARLQLTFAGADTGALIERARVTGFVPAAPPSSLRADRAAVDPGCSLPSLAAAHDQITALWGEAAMLEINRKHDAVFVDRAAWDVTAEGTLALVRDWPFEACTTTSLDPTWWAGYRAIHGWGFLLKGNGHRLVSPRIVDRGPWRRLHDPGHDVTLFQFHDLDAGADTALEQARPGHALLAPVWLGGHYASQLWVFRGSATGYKPTFYDPATQTSVVLVQDREVPAPEMGIASATRVHQIFSQPVAGVAFVYMDEAVARRQLPQLWLYGLEVRAMTAQGEQRIDRDYQPPQPPQPPSWVKRLG
jgi:hypothetical protein